MLSTESDCPCDAPRCGAGGLSLSMTIGESPAPDPAVPVAVGGRIGCCAPVPVAAAGPEPITGRGGAPCTIGLGGIEVGSGGGVLGRGGGEEVEEGAGDAEERARAGRMELAEEGRCGGGDDAEGREGGATTMEDSELVSWRAGDEGDGEGDVLKPTRLDRGGANLLPRAGGGGGSGPEGRKRASGLLSSSLVGILSWGVGGSCSCMGVGFLRAFVTLRRSNESVGTAGAAPTADGGDAKDDGDG